jgi:hypothetical protein
MSGDMSSAMIQTTFRAAAGKGRGKTDETQRPARKQKRSMPLQRFKTAILHADYRLPTIRQVVSGVIQITDAKINRLGIVRTVAIGLRQVGLLALFTEEIERALIIPEELERQPACR